MYNSKYISIKQIANKIKRGKFYKDIPFESVISYGVEAMQLIMNEKFFITKPAVIDIKLHKAKLPCDFEFMLQATKYDCILNSFSSMNVGTDSFHESYDKTGIPNLATLGQYTYTTNNGIVFTNFKEGQLFMIYKAIPMDEKDELPLIPDEVNVKLAVEFYIKYNYLNDMGSDEAVIERRANSDEQQYTWYVGKAQAAATNMTLDEMESFANSMAQLFDDPNQFQERLEYLHTQEFLNLQ